MIQNHESIKLYFQHIYSKDATHNETDSNNKTKFRITTGVSKITTRVPDIRAADSIRKLSKLSNTFVVRASEKYLRDHNHETISSTIPIDSTKKKVINKPEADSSKATKAQSKMSIKHPKTESKFELKSVNPNDRTDENDDILQRKM